MRLVATSAGPESLDVILQTSFVEERDRAATLRDAVRKADSAKNYGEALARAEEILNDLPFHEGAIDEATRVAAALRDRGEAESKRLEDDLRDVEFLPTEATVEALERKARAAVAGWKGTRFEERVRAVAAACAARRESMEREKAEGAAKRLLERAKDLDESGRPGLATMLRQAAERRAAAGAEPGGEGAGEDGGL
jgi:hypothetical protein